MRYDAIVIGGGHNGLTCAAYLARAGRRVLVLERRHVLGGAAVTEEVFPGFKFSVCSYVVSLLRPEIIRELDLPRHGMELLPLDGTFTPMPGGDYLWRVNDHYKTRREIMRHSRLDAEAYDEYGKAMVEMGRFAKPILGMLPPDPTSLDPRGLLELLGMGRRFRQMRYHDRLNQVQLLTMSAIDFLDQWFETDVLKATMAASGIIGTFLGVRSPGTAYVLLHHYMGEIDGAFRSWGLSRGGTGAVSDAIAAAARELGAEIRTDSPVARILTRNGRATGVGLGNGDEIAAKTVISSVDPNLTFLKLLDPRELPDDFVAGVRRYKFRGSSGKVNLALDALPDFTCLPGPGAHLRGAMSISPSVDYMEQAYDDAKYGRFSRRPYMDIVIPSLTDPSVAPPGKHVMSCFVQYAPVPAEGRHLGRAARRVRRRRHRRHRAVRAEHPPHHPAPPGADAARPRAGVRPDRGQHLPGRADARAALLPASRSGMGAVCDPDRSPVHVRIGDAPRRRHHGRPGPQRRGPRAARGARVSRHDLIVVGGGVNGLVCAAMAARAGLRTVLLEQRAEVGGCAAESEIAPGFRVPTLAHATGPVRHDVVEDLQLASHGLRFGDRRLLVSALGPEGLTLEIHRDPDRTAASLRPWSARDADAWPSFARTMDRLGRVVATVFTRTPPSVDDPGAGDAWTLMRTVGAFRGLPKEDAWRLLRWGPMAVADLVSECFETELLRATIAADGIFGAMLGPWSAGSGLMLLLHAANQRLAWPGGEVVAGGPAALARAVEAAARRHGVEIRTGARVERVVVTDDKARGVTLAGGEVVEARAVASGVDPKRTFLALCDAGDVPPEFLWRMKHYRARGTLAKVNLALSALPAFGRASREALAGRVRIGPDLDHLERAFDHAKYGRFSPDPWIEFTIPSLADPALAPSGGHVLSAYVQFAPYRLRDRTWDDAREELGDAALQALERHAPGLRPLIVRREVLTPLDLERGWGLTGGQIFHGELSLDQFFTMRPLLGFGAYRTPIKGLYLCGSGAHPGTGLTGGSGANAARVIAKELT